MIRCALALLLPIAAAHATSPAAFYFGHSLLCRQQSTGAVCELWLNPDGRYAVFYDSRHPTRSRYEGRQGAYQITAAPAGVRLCLRPDTDPTPRTTTAGVALFHDPGCLTLPIHPIGEPFTLQFGSQTYRLLLVQGR
jgi:hypothetical protein